MAKTEIKKPYDWDKWHALLDEFRSTEIYRKSGGVLLMPKFFEWLTENYEAPNKKK